MLKFFTNPASKYAYLRTLKRPNLMIRPRFEGCELVRGITIKEILRFVPSRLLKSLT